MTQTVSDAVAKRGAALGLVDKYGTDFAAVLPSHVKSEVWIGLIRGVLRKDPMLAEAADSDPGSLLAALLDCARQGLEPGTEQYYLIPFKNKGRLQVQGIRGYQGDVELIYRAGAVSAVIVETVHAADRFAFRPGVDERPDHEVNWFGDRGELIGVYAYATMANGSTSKVVVLNRDDINRIRASSQSANSDYSPWKLHEKAMWLKSALKQLRKWVPTSAEYRREEMRSRAEYARAAQGAGLPADPPAEDLVDGEVVDEGWPETAQPPDGAS